MFPRRLACLGFFLVWLSPAATAHHSYAAEFDSSNPQTIEGVVEEVWFKNPHIRYYVSVVGEDGEVVVWDARGLSPVKLVRQGWTRKTIQAGDRIRLHGHVGHTNKTIMSILEITLEDGTVLSSRSVSYDIKDDKE